MNHKREVIFNECAAFTDKDKHQRSCESFEQGKLFCKWLRDGGVAGWLCAHGDVKLTDYTEAV